MSTAIRAAVLCVALLNPVLVAAVDVSTGRAEGRVLPALRVVADEIDVTPSLRLDAQRAPLLQARVADFVQRHGDRWEVHWDARSDRPNLVQGQGITLLPGRGNGLDASRLGLPVDRMPELEEIEAPARALIAELDALLDLDAIELRLDRERSLAFGPDRHHWFIEFGQYHDGVRVDGAFVFLRESQGNVVQFGAERVAPVEAAAPAPLARERAFEQAWAQLGFPANTRVGATLEPGELRLYPALTPGERLGERYTGPDGEGYDHRYGWRFVFRVEGDPATWQVLFDPVSAEVFDLRDLNRQVDATLRGGVYPSTNSDPEISVTFPFAAVENGTTQVTDEDGVYDYAGGTATTALAGRYALVWDRCGALSLSDSTDGELDLGTSAGTDCTTPDVGGPGNTHAARNTFYHLTLINAKARAILPDLPWLQSTVVANTNLIGTCNAGWDGATVNFLRSGDGCSNTGELAAVILHEWGHGMDQNSGGMAREYASGEAVGDTFAFLETRDSCIGPNFHPNRTCHNCTSCTGVRDVAEFSTLGPPGRPVARPDTIASNEGLDCDRYLCPFFNEGTAYQGPMGYQGHCESQIASGATWDLTQSLVGRHGDEGWERMDRLWYSSLVPTKSAYQVVSGGQCNVAASVDGCGATNWYTVFLAADDDDGNLANGTPDACRIWDAFDAHGIACGTRPACSEDAPDFTLAVSGSPRRVCAGGVAQYGIAIGSMSGFANPVTLAASNLPGASTAQIAPNPITPVGAAALDVAVDADVASGTYVFSIEGSAAASEGSQRNAVLRVDAAPPVAVVPVSPTAAAIGVLTRPELRWQPIADAVDYRIELARDAAFTDIVADVDGITATKWVAPALERATPYYWRVRARNACGDGAVSPIRAFTTAGGLEVCRATAVPISWFTSNEAIDSLVFPPGQAVGRLRLALDIEHGFVGDLVASLTHGTTTVVALDRPGMPPSTSGCGGSDIDVVFDDAAVTPVEGVCSGTPPTIAGVLRPNNPLSSPFAGADATGAWTIRVRDHFEDDGGEGSLDRWCLDNLIDVPTYGVGGRVDGLAGAGLVLQLDDAETLAIDTDGAFAFLSRLSSAAPYRVEILSQPVGPSCEVRDGVGAIPGADVTGVGIVCGAAQYSVSGVLAGLVAGEIDLTLNATQTVTLDADGAFAFPATIGEGSGIDVRLTRQTEPLQRCTLSGASATMQGANYDALRVDCKPATIGIFADGFDP